MGTGMFMDLNAWQRSVSTMVDTNCFSTIFVDGNHKRKNQNVPFTCFACRVHNQSLFVHSSHVTSANVLILLGSPRKSMLLRVLLSGECECVCLLDPYLVSVVAKSCSSL